MVTLSEVSTGLDITGALQGIVTEFTTQALAAGPIILGAIGVGIAINLGIKWFRKFASKVG